MKKLALVLALCAVAATAFGWDINNAFKRTREICRKTSSNLVLTSTTLNFSMLSYSFATEGGKAYVKGTMLASWDDQIEVSSSRPFTSEKRDIPYTFTGTASSMTFTLEAGTTLYYYIHGVQ